MSRITVALLLLLLSLPAVAACDPTITLDVKRPLDVESEPAVVHAIATSGCPITAMHVYVDYKLVYAQRGQNNINARLVMGSGSHRVAIQAWNSAGTIAKDVRFIIDNADPVEPPAGCDIFDTGMVYTGEAIPSTSTSPVRVGMVAKTESAPISSMRMYIDGVNRAQTYGTSGYCLPVALMSLKPGYHFINVQAWDSLGHIHLSGSILQVVQ